MDLSSDEQPAHETHSEFLCKYELGKRMEKEHFQPD